MTPNDEIPARGSGFTWFALITGVVLLVVAGGWLATVNAGSTRADAPRVDSPAPAVEVSGQVGDQASFADQPQTNAPAVRVDAAWSARVAAAVGIPRRALEAYALADLVVDAEQPGCGIGWNTLAGIGAIETDHGRHGGAALGDDGYPSPAIRGPQLDGNGNAAIRDTDGGAWDGDAVWDRAVGPMQFIPDTWARWGADANGDGAADPNQIDDAALAAARYLCHSGSMTTTEGWRAAVFSYNHLDVYVDDVAAVANRYALDAG
ncbi:lytic transglycosylase domain-containing protein [Microbacterium hatanonis]|uniref:Lytic transglycosylase domain-containing protein n=1 Tax=Microbacterium hatanonis TaxID=404366 RepID=A0A5C8I6Y7_9MICO|nr:lytic murein transglycosylase [Microbacterium hatanonis]TXK13683.1 lytic transglycosylase domain-containing protein [Microbacterium hatanonis]